MIKITGADQILTLSRGLNEVGRDQLPFTLALAATLTAQKVKANILDVMANRLDRPTPLTMRSLYLKAARKGNPEARVWFKDEFTSGIPADRYLSPQVYGGPRRPKRMESALRARGLIGNDEWITISPAFQDNYGNLKGSMANRILSGLGAAETVAGVTANASSSRRSRKKGNARRFFIAQVEQTKAIWERKATAFGDAIRPIAIITTREPRYKVRVPFFKIAENTTNAHYGDFFMQAIDRTLATIKTK